MVTLYPLDDEFNEAFLRECRYVLENWNYYIHEYILGTFEIIVIIWKKIVEKKIEGKEKKLRIDLDGIFRLSLYISERMVSSPNLIVMSYINDHALSYVCELFDRTILKNNLNSKSWIFYDDFEEISKKFKIEDLIQNRRLSKIRFRRNSLRRPPPRKDLLIYERQLE